MTDADKGVLRGLATIFAPVVLVAAVAFTAWLLT